MMPTWVLWRQTASRCSWATLPTFWTVVAMPTFASCTASASSARTQRSWFRASMLHRKVQDHSWVVFEGLSVYRRQRSTFALISSLLSFCPSFITCGWHYTFSVFSPEKKPNYLKALSNIVNKLPKQVQITELPAVSKHEALKLL